MSQNKATEYFKRTIQQYLEQRAQEDELFRPRYANPQKNIDDCITFILNYVQKSGCNMNYMPILFQNVPNKRLHSVSPTN